MSDLGKQKQWVDDTGRTRWQPTLSDGRRLWVSKTGWKYWGRSRPALYRRELCLTEWGAGRVASREERREARQWREATDE